MYTFGKEFWDISFSRISTKIFTSDFLQDRQLIKQPFPLRIAYFQSLF